jgi:hypothetical protein
MASSIERACMFSRIKQRDWMFHESHRDGMNPQFWPERVLAVCIARKVGRRIEWGKGQSKTSKVGNVVLLSTR